MTRFRKKRLFSVALALVMIFGSASGAAALAAGSAPADLLILGDSISTGYGLLNPASGNYGAKLAGALELDASRYHNLAVDGATSADLAASLKRPATAARVAEHGTIVISIGGNDLLGQLFAMARQALGLGPNASNMDLQEAITTNPSAVLLVGAALLRNQEQFTSAAANFSTNLNEIVASIKAATPDAQMYIQTIYNPFGGVEEMELYGAAADMIITQMNEVIASGAAAGGYTVVDIYDAFKGKAPQYTNIAVFDIHPNAAGHTLIFQKVYALMPDAPPRNPSTGDLGAPGLVLLLFGLSAAAAVYLKKKI